MIVALSLLGFDETPAGPWLLWWEWACREVMGMMAAGVVGRPGGSLRRSGWWGEGRGGGGGQDGRTGTLGAVGVPYPKARR